MSLYIHLNPRDPTRKQDIHGNRGREREREKQIGIGERRKGGHCYLQHKLALASVGDIGALVSSVQRGERERERERHGEEEEEEEVKWTCYEIIEGDGERDDGGE